MHWEVFIIPAIALAVWVLTTIFRGSETSAPPPRRRPEQFDKEPARRAPARMTRTLEERRREAPVRRPTSPRSEGKRPIVLEEVKEPLPQTSLQSTRAGYAPTQSPSKVLVVVEKPVPTPPAPVQPVAVQTSLQTARSEYTPTQSPSQAPLTEVAKPQPSPTLRQVRDMLRSPQSAAAAFVLREIFDAPRCRQPR